MLSGIDPLLTGSILKALDDMGHSDALVIADADFPAHRLGAQVIETPGVTVDRMIRAVVSVFPLDQGAPATLMGSGLAEQPPVQSEIIELLGDKEHELVERYEFYERARDSFVVISTGEERHWANVILYKGLPDPSM